MDTPGIVAGGELNLAISKGIINSNLAAGSDLNAQANALDVLSRDSTFLSSLSDLNEKDLARQGLYGTSWSADPSSLQSAPNSAIVGNALRADAKTGGVDVLPALTPPPKPSIFGVAALGYALWWLFK